MDKSKRAIRRHHVARLKQARKHYWGWRNTLSGKQLGLVVATPKMCGCWKCSNYRDTEGPPFSEVRMHSYADQDESTDERND